MPKSVLLFARYIPGFLALLCVAGALSCAREGGGSDRSNPQVETVETTPAVVQPGATGVGMTITIRNLGAATTGAVSGTLTPKDAQTTAHVGNLQPVDTVPFTTTPLDKNATAQNAQVFTFNVSAAHNDGSPLLFSLMLTDGTAAWPMDVSVPVPWPVLSVAGSELTATTDNDHLPDPGETVGLSLSVKNTGTGSTAGVVTGTLSVNPASTAPVTINAGSNTDTFGASAIAAGATITCATGFLFTVDPAATRGTQILLDLTLNDGSNTWMRTITLLIPL
jgi:hypothetical protein